MNLLNNQVVVEELWGKAHARGYAPFDMLFVTIIMLIIVGLQSNSNLILINALLTILQTTSTANFSRSRIDNFLQSTCSRRHDLTP